MNNTPLVSIIVNCYNGEKYLKKALQSILDQTYQNWEVILWDNKSSDNSKKIFLDYKKIKDLNTFFQAIIHHYIKLEIKLLNQVKEKLLLF